MTTSGWRVPSSPPAELEHATDAQRADFYRHLVEIAEHISLVFRPDGTITYMSPAVRWIVQRDPEDFVGTNIIDWVDPDELDHAAAALERVLGKESYQRRAPLPLHFNFDGERLLVEVAAVPLVGDELVDGIAVTLRDVTHQGMLDQVLDGVMRGDPIDRTLALLAEVGCRQLRHSHVVVAYRGATNDAVAVVDSGLPAGLVRRCAAWDDASDQPPSWELACRERRLVVQRVPELPTAIAADVSAAGYVATWSQPILAEDGAAHGCVTAFTLLDFVPSPAEEACLARLAKTAMLALDRWHHVQMLEYAASHDSLTGLSNRAQFLSRLEVVAGPRPVGGDRSGGVDAVMFVDLDGFKVVNDEHGHLAGDRLLAEVARRLARTLRAGDTVARFGGDEFAVLCPGLSEPAAATGLAEALIAAVKVPVDVGDGRRAQVGASVGVAFIDADDTMVDVVLARADRALYVAKTAGKGRWAAEDVARSPR